MKKFLSITLCALTGLLLTGCKKEMIVGKDIRLEDITEFYYTYENINYNARYLRYRFHVEEGRYMFFHETRERKDDYGPASEEDITAIGDFELTDEEWKMFFNLLKDGKVKNREESLEDGDCGPWLYLYWKNDRSRYQEYSFVSWEAKKAFEDFCASLAAQDR